MAAPSYIEVEPSEIWISTSSD